MPTKPIHGTLAAVPPFKDDPTLACRTHNPDLWFPDVASRSAAKEAKKLCGDCPKRTGCLRWALDTRQAFGIFGAMTAAERAQILKRDDSDLRREL